MLFKISLQKQKKHCVIVTQVCHCKNLYPLNFKSCKASYFLSCSLIQRNVLPIKNSISLMFMIVYSLTQRE